MDQLNTEAIKRQPGLPGCLLLSARVVYQLLYCIGWTDAGTGQGIDLLQDLTVLIEAEINHNPTVCFIVVTGLNFRAGCCFPCYFYHPLFPRDFLILMAFIVGYSAL